MKTCHSTKGPQCYYLSPPTVSSRMNSKWCRYRWSEIKQMDPQGRSMDVSFGNNAHIYTEFRYEEIINTIAKRWVFLLFRKAFFSLKICSNIVKMLQRPRLILCCFDVKDSLERRGFIFDYRLPFIVEGSQGRNSGKRSWRNTGYAWFQWEAPPSSSYNPGTSVHCWYCPWWASPSHISQ